MSIWSGTPQDIKAVPVIRHPATKDLFAKVTVNQSNATKNLLAIMVVRQEATKDMAAEFVVQQPGTATRFAKMVIRHPGTASLLGHTIIRQEASVDLIAEFGVSRDDWIPQGITYAEYILRVRSTIIA